MSIVVLKLPDVKRKSKTCSRECPYCQGVTLQLWGGKRKPVKDSRLRSVKVYHYRCCHCRRTPRQARGRQFRHYPQGVSRASCLES